MSFKRFFGLEAAPGWGFNKRQLTYSALALVVFLGARWHYGPTRVPPGTIVVYGANWCGYTQALREYLKLSGVPYENRDIDASTGNFIRYLFASGKNGAIPVLQVGPNVVSKGFYPGQIDPVLRSAGYTPVEVTMVKGEGGGTRVTMMGNEDTSPP